MSVYDFNHHEQLISNYNSNNTVCNNNSSNGNNNNNSNINNNNISVSNSSNGLRPRPTELVTSKTAMYVRQRRAMLEQLSCHLCQGYLIDATTVDECMDSFCRSCIIKYLRTHGNCPKCGVLIHETNPLGAIRSDKVLQDIVYKLVPGLYDDEMKRRRDFYRGVVGSSSSESDEDASSESMNGINPLYNNERYGVISYPKQFYKPTDDIDVSIEPHTRGDSTTIYYDNRRQSIVTSFTGNIQQQQLLSSYGSLFSLVESQKFKTYLRCPAKLTAIQLKKLIAAKFNICRDDTIHLLYLNESLKDAYSLIDIAYIYDWRGIEHMRLFYIIERNLSACRDHISYEPQRAQKTVSRHSVGTSTQTVKRVCIDPNPKYYEVQSKSTATSSSSNGGRNLRHRDEGSMAKREVGTVATSSPSPILRSTGTASAASRYTDSQTNGRTTVIPSTRAMVSGFKSRELVNLGAGAQGARQSQFTDAVSTAIDELSRLKQDGPKETRSSRKISHCESTATRSIPKLNINLGSMSRSPQQQQQPHQSSYAKAAAGVTYSKFEPESSSGGDSKISRDINSNQVGSAGPVVPYYNQMLASRAIVGGNQPQSSIVTLASYAQAQNNHIVAVSHSTTTAITSGARSYNGSQQNYQQQQQQHQSTASNIANLPSSTQSSKSQQPQQLAFSIVTERGITIVRRNNQDAAGPHPSSNSASISYPALPAPESSATSQSTNTTSTSQARHPTTGAGSSLSTTSSSAASRQQQQQHSSSGGSGGSSPKNHMKSAKPVYKLFVDPSKLKSPNYKKLGTARH